MKLSAADWGRPLEGHIVGKQKALETYEEIVRGRIDPFHRALVQLRIERQQSFQVVRVRGPHLNPRFQSVPS